jgi:SpoVK/Ycf46/Vps4 family AAA+-type ATPase
MDEKKINISIPYKSSLASIITSYSATFCNIKDYTCEGFIREKDNYILDLSIPLGINIINYRNNKIFIEVEEIGDPQGLYFSVEVLKRIKVYINYKKNDEYQEKKDILFSFFDDARKHYDKKEDSEIICKILKNSSWYTLSKLPKRELDTVYLNKKDKDSIFNDLKSFFENEKKYHKFGIPYKRNYLLEGEPGAGKTSLIFALASYFNMSIHIIHLGPKVDDSLFMSSINSLPNNTILLLEDIDALFVDRKNNDSNKSMVSFSGILNVLDGIGRKNKLITFMTTNYIDRLDKALIRPGRIDYIMHFDFATEEQINSMFIKYFPNKESDFSKFYRKIEYLKVTTATLQKFFFDNLDCDNIIKKVNVLKRIIDENKKKNDNIDKLYS